MEKYGEERGDRAENARDVLCLHSRLLVPGQPSSLPAAHRAGTQCVPAGYNSTTHLCSRGCFNFAALWAGMEICLTNEEFLNDRSCEGWFQRALCVWLGYYVGNKVQAVIETFPAALSSLVWVPWYPLTHLLSQYNQPYCEKCLFSSASLMKFCKAVKADYLWNI